MAVTVYHIPKLIIELALDTGGDLPDATTYYFTGFYMQGVAAYYNAIPGAAADQVSITTTAPNQKIVATWKYDIGGGEVYGIPYDIDVRVHLKWDYYSMLDGGGEFYRFNNLNDPAISDETDPTTGHLKWTHDQHVAGFSGDTQDLTTTQLKTNSTGGRGFPHAEISTNFEYYPQYTNMDLKGGALAIEFTGADNTETDLIDALQACTATGSFELYQANDYQGSTRYHGMTIFGRFFGDGTGTIERLNCNLITGAVECPNLLFKGCSFSVSQLQYYNRIRNTGSNFTDCTFYHNGNTMDINYLGAVSNFRPYSSSITSYGSIIGFYFQAPLASAACRYYREAYVLEDSTWDNCYLSMVSWGSSSGGPPEVMSYENLTFKNNVNYDIYVSATYLTDVVDQTFNILGVTSDREFIKMRFYSVPAGSTMMWNILSTINFTITDHNGDFIEDATITVTNDNSDVLSDVTDVNGELTLNPKTYTVEYDITSPDGGTYMDKTTNMNPLTITISKSGYVDYVSIVEVAGINDWEISLKAAELSPLKFTNVQIT